MLRITMRTALLVLICALLNCAPATAARPPAGTRTVNGAAHVTGELSFAINGNTVELIASGEGISGPWGAVEAQATWAPNLADVLALIAGDIDSLTINTGTFAAEFEDGSTIGGTISGTVRPRNDGTFGLVLDFVVTSGTGDLAGATGGGTLRAVEDPESMEFDATLRAKLNVPD